MKDVLMRAVPQVKVMPRIRRSTEVVLVALSLLAVAPLAHAGAGWADNIDKAGVPFKQPTFYANSPMGVVAGHGPLGSAAPEGSVRDTGTPLQKFVDNLPLVDGYGGINLPRLNPVGVTGRHIPLATREAVPAGSTAHSVSYPDADYYEIAVVEYREQLHRDLPPVVTSINPATGGVISSGGTTLRGYVQVWTPNLPPSTVKTQLWRLDGTPVLDNKGLPVFIVGDKPHYLGPIIDSQSGVPVRIRFDNYLPTGHFDPITKTRGGDVFLPTDFTVPGSGIGPNGALDPNYPQPFERYTQNRTNIHLHGGDTPWISDGEPHSWITPAGEATPYPTGASTQNVPDMPDPGPGSQTYFYPNNQSARMMWYHDHSYASTRIDVYAGIVSAFMIHDATEAALKTPGGATVTTANGTFTFAGALAGMDEVPLIFEDKTFVPKDVDIQDSKWNKDAWGQYGDLWFPHVYEANQNPNSIDGTNPAGRWDYGPWFWPVFPAPLALPSGEYGNVSATQESFSDTPLLNGIAYPNLNVEPKAYRFRLLNASLQRYLNLGLYVAESVTVGITNPGQGYNQGTTVRFRAGGATTQATGHVVVDKVTGAISAIVIDTQGSGYTSVPTITLTNGTGAAPTGIDPATKAVYALLPASVYGTINTEVPMVDAVMPAANAAYSVNTYDGRPGGIPNPAAVGPNIIHIGTEGGFLAQPNVIPSTPVSYQQLRRIVTVLNILDHGLYVGPAERADFVVDFSAFAGRTLMLYNDCPAPNPGFDARVDYFTGDGDMTANGGADNTLPGYGPNTRTILRINVGATQLSGAGPAAPYDALNNGGPLATDLPKAFAAAQDKPVVSQSWQNTAYGTQFNDNLAHIYAGSFLQPTLTYTDGGTPQTITGFRIDSQGVGYTVAPTVSLIGGLDPADTTATAATAHAVLDVLGKRVVDVVIDTPGNGYINAPIVTLSGGDGIGASATAFTTATRSVTVQGKGIQELFEPNYGRMNATFSAELPFTSVLTQTTVPVGYIDPPTEQISDGETQFWKVTHNGVDTHVVHFHLFNVQVINRVAWDGTIVALDPAEFGWKETVKMNPLEDIYVAVKPKSPKAPFGVPQSVRLLDPTQPAGASAGFSQVDPKTGLATTVVNALYNFDWEYVWHCHILGHEENDFMRPILFNFGTLPPDPVSGVAFDPLTRTVTWTDPTPVGVPATYASKQNEQGFLVQRSDSVDANGAPVWADLPATPPQSAAQASINPVGAQFNVTLANVTSWTDTQPVASGATPVYRVLAFNAAGYSPSYASTQAGTGASGSTPLFTAVSSVTTPTAPATLRASVGTFNQTSGGFPVSVSWTASQYPTAGFQITRTGGFTTNAIPVPPLVLYATVTNGVPSVVTTNGRSVPDLSFAVSGNTYTLVDNRAAELSAYSYSVAADNGPAVSQPPSGRQLLSPSSLVQVSTLYGAAPVVTGVTLTPVSSDNAVQVSWDMPPATTPDPANVAASSHVTGFNVVRTSTDPLNPAATVTSTFSVSQQIQPLAATIVPPATSLVDPAPLPGVNTYVVYAVNGDQTGHTGSAPAAITVGAPAPALVGASASAINPVTVVLNWAAAPANTAVTGVQITRTSAGGQPVTLSVPAGVYTTFTDSTAVQNTPYTYTVQWANAGKLGTAAWVSVTTPSVTALPVTGLTATSTAGSATANVALAWTAGGPSSAYIVSRCLATATNLNCATAGSVFTTLNSQVLTPTYADNGVMLGATYVYQVQSANSPGNVSVPAQVIINTPAVPFTPTLGTPVVGAGRFSFTITEPAAAPLALAPTSYQVYRSTDGGVASLYASPAAGAPGTAFTYTDTAANAGHSYTYTVVAMNGQGSSVVSAPITAVMLVPSAPVEGTVTLSTTTTAANTNTARVTWTAATVPANAQPLTGYLVYAYVDGATTATLLSTAPTTALNQTVTLATGHTYVFVVRAQNAAGESADSTLPKTVADGEAVVVEGGVNAPAITAATVPANSRETLTLDWVPTVTSINGAAVTSYVVQWSTNAAFNAGTGTGSLTVPAAQAITVGQSTGTTNVNSATATNTVSAGLLNATRFTTVVRGGTGATPTATVYVRVNAVAGAVTLRGAISSVNAASVPPLK